MWKRINIVVCEGRDSLFAWYWEKTGTFLLITVYKYKQYDCPVQHFIDY